MQIPDSWVLTDSRTGRVKGLAFSFYYMMRNFPTVAGLNGVGQVELTEFIAAEAERAYPGCRLVAIFHPYNLNAWVAHVEHDDFDEQPPYEQLELEWIDR